MPRIRSPHGPIAAKSRAQSRGAKVLADAYREVGSSLGCHFFDAGSVTRSSRVDGIRLDADQHLTLRRTLVDIVAPFVVAAIVARAVIPNWAGAIKASNIGPWLRELFSVAVDPAQRACQNFHYDSFSVAQGLASCDIVTNDMPKLVLLSLILLSSAAQAADKMTATQLTGLAESSSPALRDAITSTFSEKDLKAGVAWSGHGSDFFFAIESVARPALFIDDGSGPEMRQIGGTETWYAAARIPQLGRLHSFYYTVGGAKLGGRLDMPAFGPLSYLQPGVPSGKLSEKLLHTSKIYDGMKSDYWIYVPAQYDPKIPAALMVFQDGSGHINRDGNNPTLNVIDNLIAQKKIPVTICVFINPGDIADVPGTPTFQFVKAYSDKWRRTLKDSMRSTLYDTVSDRYPRFLRDEVLAEVEAKYNIRKDAYSRAITGQSSGGICAFNAAWQMPGQFSRVISWIGSFTSIQWKENPNNPDGGQDYPEKVLREQKRNIRVWLADGAEDQENDRYGSWPLANIRLANALKLRGNDFHFSFSRGTHNSGHGASEFPAEMMWLWRGYDPAKTEQTYEMEESEKSKPLFRVAIVGRDAQ